MRFFPALILLCLATLGFGTVTTTTIDLRPASSSNPSPAIAAPIANKVVASVTCDADEDIIIIQVAPGSPKTVELANAQAWIYRSTPTASGGIDRPIAAGQTDVMYIEQTTTIYITRTSVTGAVVVTCIK